MNAHHETTILHSQRARRTAAPFENAANLPPRAVYAIRGRATPSPPARRHASAAPAVDLQGDQVQRARVAGAPSARRVRAGRAAQRVALRQRGPLLELRLRRAPRLELLLHLLPGAAARLRRPAPLRRAGAAAPGRAAHQRHLRAHLLRRQLRARRRRAAPPPLPPPPPPRRAAAAQQEAGR